MKKHTPFLTYWTVNSIIFYSSNLLFPDLFVIGNKFISHPINIIWIGFCFTGFLYIVKVCAKNTRALFPGRAKGFVYWYIWNFLALWVIARLAFITGFGIPKFYYALILAFLTTLSHWLARKSLKKNKLVA